MCRSHSPGAWLPWPASATSWCNQYLQVDWDEVYDHLENLGDLLQFSESVRRWLRERMDAAG